MAGIKISALPAATSAVGTDVFPADQSGPITRKISLSQVATLFNSNFVQLSPSGNQTITSGDLILQTGSMRCLLGNFESGTADGGIVGSFKAFATGDALGSIALTAANNGGNYANVLTNASTAAARTWTLPDATGTLALTADLTDFATQEQVQQSAFNYGVDTGVADAYIVDLTPAVGALTDGMMIAFTALNANATNSPTLTVNGNTAPIVTWVGLPISIDDMGQGGVSYLIYSEGNAGWMLLNGTYSNVSAAGVQNAFYTTATDAGTANAYNVTFQAGVGIGSFSPSYGSQVFFSPANTNTTPSTLVVNGQGPTVIVSMDGSTLRAGAIVSGVQAWFVFGKNMAGSLGWILMNPQGGINQNGGLVPVSVSGTSQAITAGHNYMFNNAAATTGTLPTSASSVIGDTIKVKGNSSAAFIIQANTGQTIKDGSNSSTVAGTATSAAGTDSIQLVYIAANTWSTDFTLSTGFNLA